MKQSLIQIPSAQLAYEIYGKKKVSLVVEMGLGAAIAEWRQLANRLSEKHTILIYQRAGYGISSISNLARTPGNIAMELYQLLGHIPHEEKLILLAHSQGGLYAWAFARAYPELVGRLILLDPLAPEDYRFRMELTEAELKKSGVDKSKGLEFNLKLARMHMGWLVKRMMSGAPPFYYNNSFSEAERKEILTLLGKAQTYETALAEYERGHDLPELVEGLKEGEAITVPLTLVTHDSKISCREIQEFGKASETEARKIESLWQEIMRSYLVRSTNSEHIYASHSSHYIHLTDPDLICQLV